MLNKRQGLAKTGDRHVSGSISKWTFQVDSSVVCQSLFSMSVSQCAGFAEGSVHLVKIRRHPESFRPSFCQVPGAFTAHRMEDIFSTSSSPEGSKTRSAEERVATFWTDYLQDPEGNLSVCFMDI